MATRKARLTPLTQAAVLMTDVQEDYTPSYTNRPIVQNITGPRGTTLTVPISPGGEILAEFMLRNSLTQSQAYDILAKCMDHPDNDQQAIASLLGEAYLGAVSSR